MIATTESTTTTTTTVLLTGAALGLSVLWWLSTRRPKSLPPGPGPAVPILGHMVLMEQDPRAKFRTWRRQYGDIFSLYMGSHLVVVLNGYDVIKEALVKMADQFSNRSHTYAVDNMNGRLGECTESNDVIVLCWLIYPKGVTSSCG
jgi:hypothetical protein